MSTYKPAKTLDEQIKYLKENKRVCFNIIDEKHAKDILFKYNYINIITPFKHHFAIVLNRKDNPYSRTLTVLPLTSKNKKSNINLGNELIRGVFVETTKQIYKIISSILNIKQYTVYDDLSLEVTTSDNSILKNNDANYYIMNELSCLLTEGISNFTISKENDLEDLQNRLEQLLRITDYYSAKKEDSYAIVSSVTTISKLRINKPINDFDPIGKIRVSESVLKDIDRSIAKTILNLDNEI